MPIDSYEWHKACIAVVAAAKASKPGAMIRYAGTYANAGMSLSTDEERRVQALYILSNLGTWKGEEAKRVKEYFKRVSKK